MSKDAYYFSHDSNARNDQKICKLRVKYGWEGYGIYFALIEIMREQDNYILGNDDSDIDALAMQMQCERNALAMQIKYMIELGLFCVDFDGGFFYSKSLLNRMEKKDAKSKIAQKSAEKRWNKNSNKDSNAMQMQCERNAAPNANAMLERKGKKKKEKSKEEDDDARAPEREQIESGPFAEFLAVYPDYLNPTEKDQQDAKDRFTYWTKRQIHPKHLIQAAKNYALACEHEAKTERYIKRPQNFLAPIDSGQGFWQQYVSWTPKDAQERQPTQNRKPKWEVKIDPEFGF